MFEIEGNILLLILVLWPAAAALLCYLIGNACETGRDYAVIVSVAAEFLLSVVIFILWKREGNFIFTLPAFGIGGLNFQMDGFRAMFCGLTAFLWLSAGIFSKEYMAQEKKKNRFYFFFLLTLCATEGVFLSADLMTTFVFFEIMSFTSYVWVVQEETREARRAGESYLAIAVISGLVLLMGLFLLNAQTGTLKINELLSACRAAKRPELLTAAGFCLLFGFGAKAGMFPLHTWLPRAYPAAPAPATALLSGILTKAGLFGIFVTAAEILWKDEFFGTVVLLLGTVTMVFGGVYALISTNMKRVLACSSMSQIGFVLVGVGMIGILGDESVLAVRGVVLHTLNHSLFKLVLFLCSGVVFMNLHEISLNQIRGFGRNKPLLKVAFLSAALGISGVPLFSGYLSKTLLHESIVEGIARSGADAGIFHVIEVLFLISGGLTAAYMTKLYVAIFVEENEDSKKMEASFHPYMSKASAAAIAVPAVLFPVLGSLPYLLTDRLTDQMQGIFGMEGTHAVSYFSLKNLSGALISLGIGALLYFFFVRKALMRPDKNGRRNYLRPTSGLDLEDGLYRPVLLVLLPMVCGAICRVLDRLMDNFVLFLRKTIYRHTKPKKKLSATREAYIIGMILDEMARVLNKTILRKHPIKRKSFVGIVEVGEKTAGQTGRLIARSVSFGLLLFSIGLLSTLLYLLFLV